MSSSKERLISLLELFFIPCTERVQKIKLELGLTLLV